MYKSQDIYPAFIPVQGEMFSPHKSPNIFTVNNKKIQIQNIGGKSQAYLNYSTDILKWKMIRIYKLFPAYSVSEK